MNNFEIIALKEIWKIWFIMGNNKIIWNVEINEMKKSRKFEQDNSYGKRKFVALTLMEKKRTWNWKSSPHLNHSTVNNFGKQSYFLNMAKTSHEKFWKKVGNLKINWEKIAN